MYCTVFQQSCFKMLNLVLTTGFNLYINLFLQSNYVLTVYNYVLANQVANAYELVLVYVFFYILSFQPQ